MKLTTKIGGPMRVVRHEPVMISEGTPYEREDDMRVRVVMEYAMGGRPSPDSCACAVYMHIEDAKGFSVGELVRLTLEVARYHEGSLHPNARTEVPG